MAVKYAILGLLHYKNMHGYQIKKHIENHFGYMWTINYGQIYPNLKKMQEEGLVFMELSEPGTQGPHRKLYSITAKGREEFTRWLLEAPENGMLLRDPFLMRFVFFGFGDDARALELIDEQIALYEKQLAMRLENQTRWSRKSLYVKLMADLGINLNRMFLDWLKSSRLEIEARVEQQDSAAMGL
jgi:DNA-binding PadR family transcriptional regulator